MAATEYLKQLTDGFGIWQFGTAGEVDRSGGYRLVDAALGLIAFLAAGDRRRAITCLEYIERSQTDKGFRNAFSAQHEPIIRKKTSAEELAVTAWALTYAASHDLKPARAMMAFERCMAVLPFDSSEPLVTAYLLLASCELGERGEEMADALATLLEERFSAPWQWFEPKLTRAAAALPYSLLCYEAAYGPHKKIASLLPKALATLDRYMYAGVIPAPVGGQMGQTIGSHLRDIHDQTSVDAGWMVLLEQAASVTNQARTAKASLWLDWFHGNNIYRRPLVTTTGACTDGLQQYAADAPQADVRYRAESTIMYVLARSLHQAAGRV